MTCVIILRCPGNKFITLGDINKTCFLYWSIPSMISSLTGPVRGAGTVRKLWWCQKHLEGLLKPSWLGPSLRVSDPVSLGRGLRICISSKFPEIQMETSLGLGGAWAEVCFRSSPSNSKVWSEQRITALSFLLGACLLDRLYQTRICYSHENYRLMGLFL